jgi:hypothetical protein
MFRVSSRPSSGAQQLQWQPLVLPLERGDSSAIGRGRAGRSARPRPTAWLPPRNYDKPEATAAVDRLLMTGIGMPETC